MSYILVTPEHDRYLCRSNTMQPTAEYTGRSNHPVVFPDQECAQAWAAVCCRGLEPALSEDVFAIVALCGGVK